MLTLLSIEADKGEVSGVLRWAELPFPRPKHKITPMSASLQIMRQAAGVTPGHQGTERWRCLPGRLAGPPVNAAACWTTREQNLSMIKTCSGVLPLRSIVLSLWGGELRGPPYVPSPAREQPCVRERRALPAGGNPWSDRGSRCRQ